MEKPWGPRFLRVASHLLGSRPESLKMCITVVNLPSSQHRVLFPFTSFLLWISIGHGTVSHGSSSARPAVCINTEGDSRKYLLLENQHRTHSSVQILKRAFLSELSKVPGPTYAHLTRLVLKLHILRGERTQYIHSLHQRYG